MNKEQVNHMAKVGIREAAELVGKSYRTLYRHIKQGHVSAATDSDGTLRIDTSELIRAYGEIRMDVTEEAIKVMEHWLNGGEVEFKSRHGGNWKSPSCGSPSWNWYDCQYRIKKEPLEVWCIDDDNWEQVTLVRGRKPESCGNGQRIVLLREVTDEPK